MKLNIPVDSIEAKYLTPDLRKKISGGEQTINNYTTNVSNITNINGVIKAKCISDSNITLNDTTTIIDGYTCIQYDIILVAGQTDKTENGLYRYDTTFVRYDFEAGDLIAVLNGTDYQNSLWKNTNNEIDVGTTEIEFEQINVINYLADVNIDTPANNEVLTYKDGEWVNMDVSSIADGTENDTTLRWNGSNWVETKELKVTTASMTFGTGLSSSPTFQIKASSGANSASLLLYITKGGSGVFSVNGVGDVFCNNFTAGSYLGVSNTKRIVNFPSPNLMKANSADQTDSIGGFVNGITSLGFLIEALVLYELTVKLAFGNVSGRNGSVRMYADGTNFTFRPFIMGNFSGAAPDVIYQNDSTATQPFNMDNGNPLTFQTTGTNSIYELKGLFISSSAIPNLRLQFKTDDIGLPLVLKGYSYMKISR